MKKRGKKARLTVDPLEQEYVRRYGRLPNYDFMDFRCKYGGDVAGNIIQERMDGIWQDMKESHNPTFKNTDNNPFDKSDNQVI